MKAEHRKELETNVLADRMGRMVKRVRTGPRRRTILLVGGGIVVLIGIVLYLRQSALARTENSVKWLQLDDGAGHFVSALLRDTEEANQSKALRFELAWFQAWGAIQSLGRGPQIPTRDREDPNKLRLKETLQLLDEAESFYTSLAKECADDPIWEPEARYHLAVLEEARAVKSVDHLRSAQKMYEELRDGAFKNSAYAQMAAKRAEQLADEKTHTDISRFYEAFGRRFRFGDAGPMFPDLKGLFNQK